MAAGSITEECAVAVSADRLWKAAFAGDKDSDVSFLPKACAGLIDAVEVDGDGGPGTVTTMKVNPAVEEAAAFKTRLVARDAAARVIRAEVLEAGELHAPMKKHVIEVKLEPAAGACVARVTVEYERLDGAPLPAEHRAKLAEGYLGLIKKVEAYLVAHPAEFA